MASVVAPSVVLNSQRVGVKLEPGHPDFPFPFVPSEDLSSGFPKNTACINSVEFIDLIDRLLMLARVSDSRDESSKSKETLQLLSKIGANIIESLNASLASMIAAWQEQLASQIQSVSKGNKTATEDRSSPVDMLNCLSEDKLTVESLQIERLKRGLPAEPQNQTDLGNDDRTWEAFRFFRDMLTKYIAHLEGCNQHTLASVSVISLSLKMHDLLAETVEQIAKGSEDVISLYNQETDLANKQAILLQIRNFTVVKQYIAALKEEVVNLIHPLGRYDRIREKVDSGAKQVEAIKLVAPLDNRDLLSEALSNFELLNLGLSRISAKRSFDERLARDQNATIVHPSVIRNIPAQLLARDAVLTIDSTHGNLIFTFASHGIVQEGYLSLDANEACTLTDAASIGFLKICTPLFRFENRVLFGYASHDGAESGGKFIADVCLENSVLATFPSAHKLEVFDDRLARRAIIGRGELRIEDLSNLGPSRFLNFMKNPRPMVTAKGDFSDLSMVRFLGDQGIDGSHHLIGISSKSGFVALQTIGKKLVEIKPLELAFSGMFNRNRTQLEVNLQIGRLILWPEGYGKPNGHIQIYSANLDKNDRPLALEERVIVNASAIAGPHSFIYGLPTDDRILVSVAADATIRIHDLKSLLHKQSSVIGVLPSYCDNETIQSVLVSDDSNCLVAISRLNNSGQTIVKKFDLNMVLQKRAIQTSNTENVAV